MTHHLLAPSMILACVVAVAAQNPAVTITSRHDTPQVRVFVATLQPRAPAVSAKGHATNRVIIYLDDGTMTRTEGTQTTKIDFRRGDVRWVPSSGPYTAENISDRPIRILEVDLKGPPSGPMPALDLDPVKVDAQRYKVIFENEFVRVLRIRFAAHERGARHEHRLNRVVLYLNDQTGGKKDDTRIAGAATHVEENTADTAADRIAVEIK